jgi:succinate dehydrogenase / fumarate reductase cytochrome b subunit
MNQGRKMAESPQRPLSPHLQVYKWGPHMTVSILHRATGDALALAGVPLLVWWLYSLSAGQESYEYFLSWMDFYYLGYVVLVGMSFAFFEHLFSGLRHFVMDAGAGYELQTNKMWSIAVPLLAVITTGLLWLFISYKNFI